MSDLYWLHRFLEDANADGQVRPVSQVEFYPKFAAWLAALGITSLPDLLCEDISTGEEVSCFDIVPVGAQPGNANVRLVATRGTFYIPNLRTTDDFVDAIEDTRAKIDPVVAAYPNFATDPDYDSFAIGYIYLFWQQYLTSYDDLYKIVGLCLAGVFGAMFLLQFSLVTSVILSAVIVMVAVEVYGFLPLLDLEVNAFSTTNVVLSLGMAIEFTSHVAHQFLVETGTRDERVKKALRFMGMPMFHGAVSSILAVLFIAGSKTPFLRNFYFQMFAMIIVVAFVNGTVLLPVLLSLFGASSIHVDHAEETLPSADDKDEEYLAVGESATGEFAFDSSTPSNNERGYPRVGAVTEVFV
jgi:hypothetical protein